MRIDRAPTPLSVQPPNGNLDQGEADELLADLEARVREALREQFQFGGRGVPADGSGQP